MRIIRIITLIILTANICFGQFKLKQMERCFDMASQTYVDSCFIMTDSRGFQTYIDLSVLKQIAGTPSPSALCAAIAGFGIGSLQVNDHVIARNTNGTCWKSSLEFVNTNPTCLTVGLNNGTITSTLTLKPDGGIKCSGSGLEIDLCPYFATLPAPVPYAGQALLGQDCNTYTVDVSIDCNDLQTLFTGGSDFLQENDVVLTFEGGQCIRKKVPCWKPCDGLPDINPMLPRLQKEIEDLKKENKELRKLITDIQKKLK